MRHEENFFMLELRRVLHYNKRMSKNEHTLWNQDEEGDVALQLEMGFVCKEAGDIEGARSWFRTVAEAGNPAGQMAMAMLYLENEGDEEEMEQGFYWLQLSVEQGYPSALYLLSTLCRSGYGTLPQDEEEADSLLHQAADAGDDEAQLDLGEMYFEKGEMEEALRYFHLSALQGNEDAMYLMGLRCLSYNKDEEPDYVGAAKWFLQAAEKGHARAQLELAMLYLQGDGVEKNLRAGIKWLKSAADQGVAEAQHELGERYASGEGVPFCSPKKAVKLYRQAAKQGYTPAMVSLSICYLSGQGIEKDEEEGLRLMRDAAEQGDEVAIETFRILREKGMDFDDGKSE